MKLNPIKLLATSTIVYIAILFFLRGLLPQEYTPPIAFLVFPLFLVIVIVINELTLRATTPSRIPAPRKSRRTPGREVQSLTKRIETASFASTDYFESLRERLREILIKKITLETGMDEERVKQTLYSETLGPRLLHDETLHRLLYSGQPSKGQARLMVLQKAVILIEAWNA